MTDIALFKVNDRVLVTDANTSSSTPNDERPLYEAIIRKSSLKYIDPITRKILPESKKRGGRNNAKHNTNSNIPPPPDGEQAWCHLVHYNGWNVRHDKWMCEKDNIFKDTPENRQRVGGRNEQEEEEEESSSDEEEVEEERADNNKPKDASEIRRQAAKLGWERRKKMLAEKSGGSAAVNASGKKMKSKKRSIDEINNEESSSSSDDEEEEEDLEIVYQKNLQLITDACTLPFTLQTKLIDDRERITKIVYRTPNYHTGDDNPSSRRTSNEGITMLHKLPSTMNMIQIMGQYIKDKKQDDLEELANDSEEEDDEESISSSTKAEVKLRKKQRKKFANDVVSLVDLVLPLFLLYNEEREQYTAYINERENTTTDSDVSEVGQGEKDKRRPCAIYGADHLIRFFVKLPSIISKITPTSESGPSELYILSSAEKSKEFAYHVNELLVYLQKNVKHVFTENYFAVER